MKQRLPDIVLVIVTFIWGGTFAATQQALRETGPFGFVMLRFTIAALVLGVLLFRRLRHVTAIEVYAGLGIGGILFAAYSLQTLGLGHTTSSKSAFITAMYVPLVPIVQLGLFGRRPSPMAWFGTLVSFVGLALLSCGDGFDLNFGLGEWLTLGCALASALQIVLVSKYAPETDPLRMATIQIATVAVLSLIAIPIVGEGLPHLTPRLTTISLGMGIVGTALVIGAMNWAQSTVPAMRATLIYAMEPVWAGLLGLVIGEKMGVLAALGSLLIVGGIVVAELRLPAKAAVCNQT